jgi:hypothetical protein
MIDIADLESESCETINRAMVKNQERGEGGV